MTDPSYPRDLVGYGRTPPHPRWPGDARIAVQFVMNFEEGGENSILHGDPSSEAFLSEIVGAAPWPNQRHMNMESIYEYGARVGFWRLHRLFTERGLPLTVFAVATAMMRNPDAVKAMDEAGWEIASHGYKWIEYKDFSRAEERAHIAEAVRLHTAVAGARPRGFYQGRSSEHTIPLVMEEGGFLYSADTYADELPYWVAGPKGPFLMVPYTLDANDMRFAVPAGFSTGDDFFTYLKDSFDLLYAEGAHAPRMLSIGLHNRLVGRPGRAAALARFLDYITGHEKVWVARRIDIARHWIAHHPPPGGHVPSRMSRAVFIERFGDVFEHSPWIAESAYDAGVSRAEDRAAGLCAAMSRVLRAAPPARQMSVIHAHPDLAGRLAQAKRLTQESAWEQASAGLDQLTEDEKDLFTALNAAYVAKFGFVFIMAIRGRTKDEITAAFERRLENSPEAEREEAIAQIERIALLRLEQLLPA
ncbi:allantoinase PuuE [Aquabacter spiritensis]|uniref:Chitooligosaccharide deacetylase n=1 Tax=Aquabacter spiritensis TaxID=933073 RepID=A0A4R3M2U7_9HYPH|nr:allantoinase PuuE [Aquabacter spiritensis]TCT07531.1 OHCU decarboxylase [Aquabacter spiritensis]